MSHNLHKEVDVTTGMPTIQRNASFVPKYIESGFLKSDPYGMLGRVKAVQGLHMPYHHQRSENLPFLQPQHTLPRRAVTNHLEYLSLKPLEAPFTPIVPLTNTELEQQLATYNDGVRISHFSDVVHREIALQTLNKQAEAERLRHTQFGDILGVRGDPKPEVTPHQEEPSDNELLQQILKTLQGNEEKVEEKVEPLPESIITSAMTELTEEQLYGFKVLQLKEILTRSNLSTKGKKDELIARILRKRNAKPEQPATPFRKRSISRRASMPSTFDGGQFPDFKQ